MNIHARAEKKLKWVIGVLIVSLLPAYGCKGDQEVMCSRADGIISVDGQMADWEELPTAFFNDQGVVFGLANDDDNLYVMFRFRDEKWARTIRMSGITFWFDGQGRKGKDFALKYRGGPRMSDLMQADNSMPNSMRERMIKLDTAMSEELTCAVKDRIVEMPIELDGSNGPSVAFDIDQGFFTYELKIPLEESKVRYYGIGAEEGARITIGANWGKMDMGQMMGGMKSGGGRGGGPPGGGMGGGRGGGMGGGPPGGRGGQRPEMPEEQEVWIKTTLALATPEAQAD